MKKNRTYGPYCRCEHLDRKIILTPIELHRSPKSDTSPNKHELRGLGGKYFSTSEKAQMVEEGIISESKPKVRNLESDEEDSDFDCYDKFEGNPVHVDIDKEATKGNQH